MKNVSFVVAPIAAALSAGTSRDSCLARGLKMTPCRFDMGGGGARCGASG